MERTGLTFKQLREANVVRCGIFKNAKGEFAHDRSAGINDWSLNDWCTALTGEVGEMANLLKKVRRGDMTLEEAKPSLTKEIADIQIYLDLLAARAGIDLGKATIEKFNEVSDRIGCDIILPLRASKPWVEWSKELAEVAARLYPGIYGSQTPLEVCGADAWHDYWRSGYTPEDALNEDASYGDE